MNQYGTETMEPENNLHTKIPPMLLTEAEKVAQAEHITMDEFVRDAMQRRVGEHRRQELRAYGEAQARKHGIYTENDVEQVVHQFRQEERERLTRNPGVDG